MKSEIRHPFTGKGMPRKELGAGKVSNSELLFKIAATSLVILIALLPASLVIPGGQSLFFKVLGTI